MKKVLFSLLVFAINLHAEGLKNLGVGAPKEPRFKVTDRVWATTPGEASVCLWKDDKLCAVSYTSDTAMSNPPKDDPSAKSDVDWWVEICEKYGFKKTWFVVTSKIGPRLPFGTWEQKQKLVALGHDVQSHSVTHRSKDIDMPVEQDYKDSIAPIEENIKGHRCLTLAYPGGGLANDQEIAARHFIAARSGTGQINRPAEINYMATHSLGGGIGLDEVRPDGRRNWAYIGDTLDPKHRNFRGWACTHFHGMPKDLREAVEKQFQYLKENEKDFWVGTFTEVVKYGQQHDTAELKVTKNEPEEIALLLTSKMDPELFDYPLTVKVCVPKDWKNVTAKQAGKEIESKLVEHEDHKYALVQIIPDRGEINLVPSN